MYQNRIRHSQPLPPDGAQTPAIRIPFPLVPRSPSNDGKALFSEEDSLDLEKTLRTLDAPMALRRWLGQDSIQNASLSARNAFAASRLLGEFAREVAQTGRTVFRIDLLDPAVFGSGPLLRDILSKYIGATASLAHTTVESLIGAVQCGGAVIIFDNLEAYLLPLSLRESKELVKGIRDIFPDRYHKRADLPGTRGKVLANFGNLYRSLARAKAWSYGTPIQFMELVDQAAGSGDTCRSDPDNIPEDLRPTLGFLAARLSYIKSDQWLKPRILGHLREPECPVQECAGETVETIFALSGCGGSPVLRFPETICRESLQARFLGDALTTGDLGPWSLKQRLSGHVMDLLSKRILEADDPSRSPMVATLTRMLENPLPRRTHHALKLAMMLDDRSAKGFAVEGANFGGMSFNGWEFKMSLPKADFSGCDLKAARFGSANLTGTNFQKSRLFETRFHHCDLRHARFDEVDMRKETRLHRCNVSGCTIGGTRGTPDGLETCLEPLPGGWDTAVNGKADQFRQISGRLNVASNEGVFGSFVGFWIIRYRWAGRLIAWKGFETTARLWDRATGRELAAYDHGDPVCAAAYDPSTRQVFTGGWKGWIRAWDATTGEPLGECRHAHHGMDYIKAKGNKVVSGGWGDNGVFCEKHWHHDRTGFKLTHVVQREALKDSHSLLLLGIETLPRAGKNERRLLILPHGNQAIVEKRDGRWIAISRTDGASGYLEWADAPRWNEAWDIRPGNYESLPFESAIKAGLPELCGTVHESMVPFSWK